MCGIFGFITMHGKGPDLKRLTRIAVETQARGHHAFGLAWISPDGRVHTFKRPGAATANLGDIEQCQGALAVIGHCRWATHGSPEVNRNNHPHPAGRGLIVHNGVVHNHRSLAWKYNLQQRTECDSEILGLLMARFPGPLGQRAARMAEAAEGNLALLGLWKNPTRLMIVRNGNPLCFGQTKHGFYFGSLARELPHPLMAVTNRYVGILEYEGGKLRHKPYSIGRKE
jgi:glutamine---fructose-6-phosphate transaminase (isomerizing)